MRRAQRRLADVESDPPEPWSYEEDLTTYARFLCRHREDAEDIAHTALLKAAENMSGFRGESSMRTWLHAIVTNECRMLYRRAPSLSLDQLVEDSPANASFITDEVAHSTDPTASAAQSELRALALSTLREMPSHYRTALFLQLAHHMSVDDIAEALGRSVPATRTILHRARRSMREGTARHLEREDTPG